MYQDEGAFVDVGMRVGDDVGMRVGDDVGVVVVVPAPVAELGSWTANRTSSARPHGQIEWLAPLAMTARYLSTTLTNSVSRT